MWEHQSVQCSDVSAVNIACDVGINEGHIEISNLNSTIINVGKDLTKTMANTSLFSAI